MKGMVELKLCLILLDSRCFSCIWITVLAYSSFRLYKLDTGHTG